MVYYCYTMDYPDNKIEVIFNSGKSREYSYISHAHTNAQIYALAEKYDIAGLKILASIKFNAAMMTEFGPGPRNCAPDMTHLIAIISLVYTSTPESDRVLRDRIIGELWSHWKQLSPKPDFHIVIAANPDIMIEAVNDRFGHQLP